MLRKALFAVILLLGLAALAFAGGSKEPGELTKVTFITPRGTIEVMDDYNLWVAIEMGYFKELGLEVIMEPGPGEAFAPTKFVDQKQADVGYPSPGILTSSVDTGMDVIMVYEMMIDQVFGFAVRKDSPIKSVKDFAGKTMTRVGRRLAGHHRPDPRGNRRRSEVHHLRRRSAPSGARPFPRARRTSP